MRMRTLLMPTAILIGGSFLLEYSWHAFSHPVQRLRPLLYLALTLSWITSIAVTAPLFWRKLHNSAKPRTTAVLLAATTVCLMYASYGFFSSYAEEFTLRSYTSHGEELPENLYYEFHGFQRSRGALDVARNTVRGLVYGLLASVVALPVMIALALVFVRRMSKPSPSVGGSQ